MAKPTGEQREKYESELLRELDAIDELTESMKAEMKERREEIAEHVGAAKRLRNLLAGRESEQLEIGAGAEVPSVRPRLDVDELVGTREDAVARHEERSAIRRPKNGRPRV